MLHSFGATGDGFNPSGPLVLLNGLWYGTTQYGGRYRNGTVFTIDGSGNEKILHSFGSKKDGAQPFAGLIVVKGTLYGTTEIGGKKGKGTVFSITPAGAEHVLHSFTGSPDGWGPQASLVFARGTLYGTTYYGGTSAQCGVVFGVNLDGKETVVHTFSGGKDGATPVATLVYSHGILYGTSLGGGAQGQGAAYSITLSGKFKTLHSFGVSDNWPTGMVMVNGVLYGTTDGHTDNVGVIYSLTTTGKYTKLYTFLQNGGFDAIHPYGPLIAVGGTIYGTSAYGGGADSGTIFSFTTAGQEQIVYSFGNAPDGVLPTGGVTYYHGAFYGVTYDGGSYPMSNTLGGGTVYSVTP